MIQLCRHIFHRGTACKGAAVRGTEFCRHHSSVKAALAHVQPRPDRYGLHKPLPFVYPEDRAAIQTNLFLVLQAFNDRKIDTRTANCMTYNLQVCRVNLGNQPLAEPSATGPNAEEMVRRVILTPDGDEIAPPREALEPGEQSPLHHAGCPCQRCAEQYRNAPPEQHHPNCQCGLCEDSPSGQDLGAPSLEPEATRVGNEELSLNDQSASVSSASSVLKNNSQPLNERSEELDHGEAQSLIPIEPLQRACPEPAEGSIRVQVEGQGFSPAINTTLRRSDLSAEGPSAATPGSPARGLGVLGCESEASALRTAPATKLYDRELTKDPVNQPFNLADYLYGDAHKKHEAQYAARARAAIEAGLEPPPYEPFDPAKVESEDDRRYREDREQIERNREAARLSWNKLYPDNQVEPTPYLTWGEQHDLKLAQARKQREEEEARARKQS